MTQHDDRGSAVVDFVLVGVLVIALALGLVQVAFALHVRATLASAAAEGARLGAIDGGDPAVAERRARDVITTTIGSRFARDVDAGTGVVDGLDAMTVEVSAPLPVIGVLGVPGAVRVRGHAVLEPSR